MGADFLIVFQCQVHNAAVLGVEIANAGRAAFRNDLFGQALGTAHQSGFFLGQVPFDVDLKSQIVVIEPPHGLVDNKLHGFQGLTALTNKNAGLPAFNLKT